MSQISRENSFGKVVFPFLVGNFMSRDRNWFFGRHFVILYPIFDFFVVFWFFWITLSMAHISLPNSFGKALFWVRVHRDPPLTTNGSAESLDHLSVKIICPRWCQNHDYAHSFASGIVMVLTSPRAYNFNCAPQSCQYLYNEFRIRQVLSGSLNFSGVKFLWNYVVADTKRHIHKKLALKFNMKCFSRHRWFKTRKSQIHKTKSNVGM